MNELKSYTEYAVSTPTADFVIGFDFNYGEDAVNVTVDDVPATEAGYTVVYLNETTIRLSPSVPSGVVRLQRETDIDQADHAYRAGAKFTAQTLDENFEQLRHSQQEVRDGFTKLKGDTYALIDGLDEAIGLAQDAAQDAQDAAVIAQDAADTVNAIIIGGKVAANKVLDISGKTQQEINDNQVTVNDAVTDNLDLLSKEITKYAPSSLKAQLDAVSNNPVTSCYFNKTDNNLFEVFTPFITSGRYLKWRFENKESNFVAEPSDVVQAYTRPFLQTTVQDVFLEVRTDGDFADFTVVGTPVVAGTRTYINQIGDSLTLTGIRAKRIRLNYFAAANSGKVKITINGSARLVNLIAKDVNGDAVFDTYSADNVSRQVFIADNLPDVDLTVKVEVVGKNDLSTDSHYYATTAVAYSLYSPYTGVGVPSVTTTDTLKLGGSAVDYAILFYPDGKADTPAWSGSVHGWENRVELRMYFDGTEYKLSDFSVGAYVPFNSFTLEQLTAIYNHQELVNKSASVDIVWKVNRNGASQGYTWEWLNPSFVTNGYSQMWTVYGGATGGAGGAKNGWCDRVLFGTGQQYDLSYGGAGEFGKVITNEVLFFGTKPTLTETSRNKESGDTACLVNIASPARSLRYFSNPNSLVDGIWVQDRPTFKKMYAQLYRANGVIDVGQKHESLMSVQFYKSKNLGSMIS